MEVPVLKLLFTLKLGLYESPWGCPNEENLKLTPLGTLESWGFVVGNIYNVKIIKKWI